jgi:hypothetical protein
MLVSAKAITPYNIFSLLYPLDILLTVDLPQQSFFEEVCFNVIAADKKIKFTGIVDSTGKLFFGKHRPNYNNKERSFVVEPVSFYFQYLIPTIRKCQKIPREQRNTKTKNVRNNSNLQQIRFGLVNFCSGTMKLVVIPIEEKENISKRYLCICILK